MSGVLCATADVPRQASERNDDDAAGVMSEPASQASRRMKLRYAGACRHCGTKLAAGDVAVYDRVARRVAFLGCDAEPGAATQLAPVADWPYRPRDTEVERARAVVDERATG